MTVPAGYRRSAGARAYRATLAQRFGGLALMVFVAAPASAQQRTAGERLTLGGTPPAVASEADLRRFLDDLESQEFAVNTALGLELYYQERGDVTNRAAQTARLYNDLLNRADYATVVEAWRGRVSDSVLARRLELHHVNFLQAKANASQVLALSDLQIAVQDAIDAFRYTIGNQHYDLTAIHALQDTSPDRGRRRAAFLAEVQRSPVISADVLHGMWLNDSIGKQEGFATGAEAGLFRTSLTRDQVLHDLDAFERATRPAYLALLERAKRDLGVDRIEAWDIGYWLHLQERSVADAYPKADAIRRLRSLFRTLGFRVDSLPIDVRALDIPTGGTTFPIRPPFDVRLLTNPAAGSDFYETLFHEYGHALNFVSMRPDLSPILWSGDETPILEGTAETMGWFAYDHRWIGRTAQLSPAQARRLERIGKDHLLLWLRRTICLNAWVEINAYSDLHADLNARYRDAYERFVGVAIPPADYVGNVDMLATGPLYFHSYLYAGMIAAQLQEAMREQLHGADLSRDPRVAEWMIKNMYADGGLVPWPAKILRATKRPLSIDALVAYLSAD